MGKFNVVIPAAGAATRLRPLSSNTSKIMVRVNGKPCLDYIIEGLGKDVNEIIIVDGQFNDIREYCKIRHPNIKFVKQPSLDGPRDAIKYGMNEIIDDKLPVVVWLGDAIILEKNMPLGTNFLLTKSVDNHSAWCMWDGEQYYNKPKSLIEEAVALVGLYSFANGKAAKLAFNNTDGYDISEALVEYSKCGPYHFDNIVTEEWYDIGDLPNYYKTSAALLNLKARAFNHIEYNFELGTLRKSPDYHDEHSVKTLMAEKMWYDSLTPEQSMFTPRILPSKTHLVMSYESGTLLSDLMLYDNLSDSSWDYIIDRIFKIKLKYFNYESNDMEFIQKFSSLSESMWINKSKERLNGLEFTNSQTQKLVNIATKAWRNTKPIFGMHGDLHFGNVLYNQQTDQFKLIDPRGNYGGRLGNEGDNLYDWAKLAHDLYHGYNAMVSNVQQNLYVKDLFVRKLKEHNLPVDVILESGLLLIATCIGLHKDDVHRQLRMKTYVESQL